MHCCVKGCKNDSKYLPKPHGITFHAFPIKEHARSSWLEVLGMRQWNPKNLVCSDHFVDEDFYYDKFGYRRLKVIALPIVWKDQVPVSSLNGKRVKTGHGQNDLAPKFKAQHRLAPQKERQLKNNRDLYSLYAKMDKHKNKVEVQCIEDIKNEDGNNEIKMEEIFIDDDQNENEKDLKMEEIYVDDDENEKGNKDLKMEEIYVDDDQFGVTEVEVHTNVDLTEEIKLQDDADCEFADAMMQSNDAVEIESEPSDLYGYDSDNFCDYDYENLCSDSESVLSLEAGMMERKARRVGQKGQVYSEEDTIYYLVNVKDRSPNESTYVNYEALGSEFGEEEDVDCEEIPEDSPLCEICNIRFKNATALSVHMMKSKIHALYNTQDSTSPILSTMYNGVLKKTNNNNRRKAKQEPIACEQCGAKVNGARAYFLHFRREHKGLTRTKYPTLRQPRMCDECGKFFQNSTKLRHHKSVHTGENKSHRCDKCYKTFTGRANLLNHLKTHNQLRPMYECDYCPKQYVSLFSKKRHMVIHTGEAPVYQCDKCDRIYPSPSGWKSHYDHVHLKIPWPKRRRKNTYKWMPMRQKLTYCPP